MQQTTTFRVPTSLRSTTIYEATDNDRSVTLIHYRFEAPNPMLRRTSINRIEPLSKLLPPYEATTFLNKTIHHTVLLLEFIVVVIRSLTTVWVLPDFLKELRKPRSIATRNIESGLLSLRARMGAIKGCEIDFSERSDFIAGQFSSPERLMKDSKVMAHSAIKMP